MSDKYYPGEEEDGRGDALRHLLWQGGVTQTQGELPARLVGSGHELAFGKPDPATEMDIANNQLGRELGAKTKTREELLEAAIEAVNAGRARTLKKNEKDNY